MTIIIIIIGLLCFTKMRSTNSKANVEICLQIQGGRHGKCNRLQWNPAITKCHGTEKNVCYSEDPVITNYLVNSKKNRYSRVTKLNQAEQWDINHAKQSTDLHMNGNI